MAKSKKAMFDAYEASNNPRRIPLVNLTGKYIRETEDAVCFEMSIKGLANTRREWFPLHTIWFKPDMPDFQCHRSLASKKGLL